jgi:hypothetical protein
MNGGRPGTARWAATVVCTGSALLLFLASTTTQYGRYTFGLVPGLFLAALTPAWGAVVSGGTYFAAELLHGITENPSTALLWALALAALSAAFGVLIRRGTTLLPLVVVVCTITFAIAICGTLLGPSSGAFGHGLVSDVLIGVTNAGFAAFVVRRYLANRSGEN